MIVCITGFIFQKALPVQAAYNISEEQRNIMDYEDELQFIFGSDCEIRQVYSTIYQATYYPKNSNTPQTITLSPVMTFSSFMSNFGFTSKLCMGDQFTVTTATKIRNTVINGFVMGFLTKGVPWVIGTTLGVGTSLLDQSLPAGKYKKAVIRTEIKYPEMKGSSTYLYESFICEYRVLKYNEYDKEWQSYLGVGGGADPLYESARLESFLF